jgi:hypothetical protein
LGVEAVVAMTIVNFYCRQRKEMDELIAATEQAKRNALRAGALQPDAGEADAPIAIGDDEVEPGAPNANARPQMIDPVPLRATTREFFARVVWGSFLNDIDAVLGPVVPVDVRRAAGVKCERCGKAYEDHNDTHGVRIRCSTAQCGSYFFAACNTLLNAVAIDQMIARNSWKCERCMKAVMQQTAADIEALLA